MRSAVPAILPAMFGWFRRKPRRPAWAEGIYAGLGPAALEVVARFVESREVRPDELVVREGEPALDLHVVRRGRLEVCKRDPSSGREHRIATVGPGDLLGEVGVIGELPRTASVRSLEPCELSILRFHELKKRAAAEKRIDGPHRAAYQEVVTAVAQRMSVRLRDNAEAALVSEVRRLAMGQFLVNVLILLCVYVILLSALPEVSSRLPKSTSYVSIPLQLLFAIGSVSFIRGTGYPLHLFGLSFRNAIGSVLEAVVLTVPFLAVVTGIKWLVIHTVPAYEGARLFEYPDVLARLKDPAIRPLLGVYALSSVVQELIVRSAVQSSLAMFLSGPRSRQQAILLSALLFSVTHLHMSPLLAALAFVPGVFWGYLFARRPNLLGVSLSHTVVGVYVFFVLGTSAAL
jgi:CRP-like cAMP-binding protein